MSSISGAVFPFVVLATAPVYAKRAVDALVIRRRGGDVDAIMIKTVDTVDLNGTFMHKRTCSPTSCCLLAPRGGLLEIMRAVDGRLKFGCMTFGLDAIG